MTLAIPEHCREFSDYYDALQEQISQLSVMEELLTGMFNSSQLWYSNASLHTRLGEESGVLAYRKQ